MMKKKPDQTYLKVKQKKWRSGLSTKPDQTYLTVKQEKWRSGFSTKLKMIMKNFVCLIIHSFFEKS